MGRKVGGEGEMRGRDEWGKGRRKWRNVIVVGTESA